MLLFCSCPAEDGPSLAAASAGGSDACAAAFPCPSDVRSPARIYWRLGEGRSLVDPAPASFTGPADLLLHGDRV